MLQDQVTFAAQKSGLSVKEVGRMDFLSFKALYESCERCHAADIIEQTEMKIAVAAYGAGAEEAWDVVQDRLALYRFVLDCNVVAPIKDASDFLKLLKRGRM